MCKLHPLLCRHAPNATYREQLQKYQKNVLLYFSLHLRRSARWQFENHPPCSLQSNKPTTMASSWLCSTNRICIDEKIYCTQLMFLSTGCPVNQRKIIKPNISDKAL